MASDDYTATTIKRSYLERLRIISEKQKRSMIQELEYLIEKEEKELK